MKPDGRPDDGDFTANRSARQEMVRRSRKLCHELNQPMQAISGYADLLAIGIPPDHPHYPKVEKIRGAVRQANEIIGDLAELIRSQDADERALESDENS